MNSQSVLAGLFSRITVVLLFSVVGVLLSASFYTYLQDRKLQSVSLSALRMASWNLVRLGSEASALDRELSLLDRGVGEPAQVTLRYDVLWSRYDYLLTSKESAPTREHDNNAARLQDLFTRLQALEDPLTRRLAGDPTGWSDAMAAWHRQWQDVMQLVTDNFVGDETSRLMSSVEASRDRLAKLRILTLVALAVVFGYLALGMAFLRKQSKTDPVTGLPNSHYLHSLGGVDPRVSIITCAIQKYTLVLSEYGQEGATSLTQAFARKLQRELSSDDQLIQVSASEFVILLAPLEPEFVESSVYQLVSATRFDWRIGDSVWHASAVFGVAPPCAGKAGDWQIRYQQAHRALVQASEENQSYFIDGEALRRRILEERQIHAGLLNLFNEEPGALMLRLVYQPIVSAADVNLVTGAEVLLRCEHESLGFIPPNRVVELCERYGLGEQLGCWLFRRVAAETRQLYSGLRYTGNLSINLNPAMLSMKLIGNVERLLLEPGIPAAALCMEITEDNAALEFGNINDVIEALHGLGITFALDDFGTGHSSLEYVRELKVDRLKIDRCFVEGIELDANKARFLASIVSMANQAFMKSVIEGVENESQWQQVESFGDVLVQGYYAHKPMSFNDYLGLLLDAKTRWPTPDSARAIAEVRV